MAVVESEFKTLAQVDDHFEGRPLDPAEQAAWLEIQAYRDPSDHEQHLTASERLAAFATAQEVGLVRTGSGTVRTFDHR